MDIQNLAYALTQVAHNFGAVTVVAVPAYAALCHRDVGSRGLLNTVLAGWGVQIASGVLFGLVSLFYYGQLPDIHGAAIAALILKVVCAILAVIVVIISRRSKVSLGDRSNVMLWWFLVVLGCVALTAAAFLRWFS